MACEAVRTWPCHCGSRFASALYHVTARGDEREPIPLTPLARVGGQYSAGLATQRAARGTESQADLSFGARLTGSDSYRAQDDAGGQDVGAEPTSESSQRPLNPYKGSSVAARNGGTLERAQQTCPPKASGRRLIAAHESPRTTKLYDRTSDYITLDEIERIAI
jgi:hypothetical protein